ncbi:hypothetical protein DVH24_011309 [Malus domestica]|uniref:THH1/TOM1/TOM3 domain-containing protein n=1 Tax=Malus domestica TaxID=3750 RepID=A0A498JYX3_MALDO|nr:hypothetical protein DVH24_011309 [Malus domestica]
MFGLREASCFPRVLVGVNVSLALVDGIIALLAFFQLIRIHSRNSQLGWTRQKKSIAYGFEGYVALIDLWCAFPVFFSGHSVIGVSFELYMTSLFRVDLCHQADDEDDEDEGSFREALLERTFSRPDSLDRDSHRTCFPLRFIRIGSRQRIVTLLVFVIMIASAVIIWIGMGQNPIDSALVARVYVDLFAIAILLLGGALACYGLLLFLRMRNVRSERASSEMWKVAGLAVVSVLCFASSSLVALLTDIPMLYDWHQQRMKDAYTSVLLILYYFVGSSIPSAFVLWVMRDIPPSVTANTREEPSTLTFISDISTTLQDPQSWNAAMSLRNQVQVSRTSPV